MASTICASVQHTCHLHINYKNPITRNDPSPLPPPPSLCINTHQLFKRDYIPAYSMCRPPTFYTIKTYIHLH